MTGPPFHLPLRVLNGAQFEPSARFDSPVLLPLRPGTTHIAGRPVQIATYTELLTRAEIDAGMVDVEVLARHVCRVVTSYVRTCGGTHCTPIAVTVREVEDWPWSEDRRGLWRRFLDWLRRRTFVPPRPPIAVRAEVRFARVLCDICDDTVTVTIEPQTSAVPAETSLFPDCDGRP